MAGFLLPVHGISAAFRISIKALQTVLRYPADSYDASTSASGVADILPGKGYFNTGSSAIILKEAQFHNYGKTQSFGLVKSLNDKGEATGEAFWVTLLPEYMTQAGERHAALPTWMQHAIALGELNSMVKPSVFVNILAGDAVGFLAKDIYPVGMGKTDIRYFTHIQVLSPDSRMPDFLSNPSNVTTDKNIFVWGNGGKVLERGKCNLQNSDGKS